MITVRLILPLIVAYCQFAHSYEVSTERRNMVIKLSGQTANEMFQYFGTSPLRSSSQIQEIRCYSENDCKITLRGYDWTPGDSETGVSVGPNQRLVIAEIDNDSSRSIYLKIKKAAVDTDLSESPVNGPHLQSKQITDGEGFLFGCFFTVKGNHPNSYYCGINVAVDRNLTD